MVDFDPEIRRYEERWNSWQEKNPDLVRLRNDLLDIKGEEVVPSYEPDSKSLVERGHIISSENVIYTKMRDSQCHMNVRYLYLEDDSIDDIATGWALSSDGLWRQHSWAIKNGSVVETTVGRDIYYGIILNEEERNEFIKMNA